MSLKIGAEFETNKLNKNTEIMDNPLNALSKFKIVESLGQGSYGVVYKVKHIQSEKKLVNMLFSGEFFFKSKVIRD